MRSMNYKKAVFPAACLLVISAVVACGEDHVDLSPADSTEPDSSAPYHQPDANTADTRAPDDRDVKTPPDADADVDAATCESPVAFTPDANAKTKAVAALAALSPTATLDWSDTRGTLTSISGLVVSPACTGSDDVYDKFFEYLEAHPDLFQIDRADWRGASPAPLFRHFGIRAHLDSSREARHVRGDE